MPARRLFVRPLRGDVSDTANQDSAFDGNCHRVRRERVELAAGAVAIRAGYLPERHCPQAAI